MNQNRKYTDTVAVGKVLPNIKVFFQMGLTFLLVVIGWVFFRADSIGQAFEYFGGMIQFGTLRASYRFFMMKEAWLILGMLAIEWIGRQNQHGLETLGFGWNKWLRYIFYFVLAFIVVLFSLNGAPSEFIYFQF